MIDLEAHLGMSLVYLDSASQAMIWWNCHDKLYLKVYNEIKEFPCSAMTVPQATSVANRIASENIEKTLNIFQMLQFEKELDELDVSDLIQ